MADVSTTGDPSSCSLFDNTPTYLVFFTTAGTLGFTSGITTSKLGGLLLVLMSISCGAVFMGAGTYIGNAPNLWSSQSQMKNGCLLYVADSCLFLPSVIGRS